MGRTKYFMEEELCKIMIELLQNRGLEKSICPSEVARAYNPADWRKYMEAVRLMASKYAHKGILRVTQRGRQVDILEARGPVRLQLLHP